MRLDRPRQVRAGVVGVGVADFAGKRPIAALDHHCILLDSLPFRFKELPELLPCLGLRLWRQHKATRPSHCHQSLQDAQVISAQRLRAAELDALTVAIVMHHVQLAALALATLEAAE